MNTLSNLEKRTTKKMDTIREDVGDAYDEFETGLEKRALYKTHDVEISHDLVQATFLKTLLYLQKGGKIHIMRSFLNHILNDLIIDEYRKKKTMSLELLLAKGFEPSVDNRERVIDRLDGEKIAVLIPLLPDKYQSIITMRYSKDLSLKEIAALTDQTENTVAVQAHRGLEKLRILYQASHK